MGLKSFNELFEKHKDKLNERYRTMAELWIGGMTKSDIGRKFNITPQRVGAIFKTLEGKFIKWKSTKNS